MRRMPYPRPLALMAVSVIPASLVDVPDRTASLAGEVCQPPLAGSSPVALRSRFLADPERVTQVRR